MAASYIRVTNSTSNVLSLVGDNGNPAVDIHVAGYEDIYLDDVNGNELLCTTLADWVDHSYVTVTRGSNTLTSAMILDFIYGDQMTKGEYDTDDDGVPDQAEYPTTVATTVYYVDKNRTDTYTATGNYGKPFKTVAAAITAAASGTNLVLFPGTYSEAITLKDGVSLTGMDRDRTIISSALDTVTIPTGITTKLENLTLRTTGAGGKIALKGATIANNAVTVRNCVITATNAAGVALSLNAATAGAFDFFDTNINGATALVGSGVVTFDRCNLICSVAAVNALTLTNMTTATIFSRGLIYGSDGVGAGNKAVVVSNSSAEFSDSKILSVGEDVLTVAAGGGAPAIVAEQITFSTVAGAKKDIILGAGCSMLMGECYYDNTKVTFTAAPTFRTRATMTRNDSTMYGTLISDTLNTLSYEQVLLDNLDLKVAGAGSDVTAALNGPAGSFFFPTHILVKVKTVGGAALNGNAEITVGTAPGGAQVLSLTKLGVIAVNSVAIIPVSGLFAAAIASNANLSVRCVTADTSAGTGTASVYIIGKFVA